jgi:hypothetical protein
MARRPPEIDLAWRKHEAAGHNAEDRALPSVQQNLFAHQVTIAAENPLPQP